MGEHGGRLRPSFLLAMLASSCLFGYPATSADLVASLSNHLVAITTGFTGTNVLLFGATDGLGDVVVVVRGPEAPEVVRRKGRMFGIWVNESELVFENVPGFYAVGSSRPLPLIVPESVAGLHQIGVDNLRLKPARSVPAAFLHNFRSALIRTKQREGLYGTTTAEIPFLGNRLFRTDMWIPANAPVGTYTVSVYLLRDGDVVSAESTPLIVSKVGLEARIFDFAHRYSAAYGIVAVVVAAAAGWAANLIFRKS